jgi:transposase
MASAEEVARRKEAAKAKRAIVQTRWQDMVSSLMPNLQAMHRGGRAYGREMRERVMELFREEKMSVRGIAERFKMDRKTVTKYIEAVADDPRAIPMAKPRGGWFVAKTRLPPKVLPEHKRILVQVAAAMPRLKPATTGRFLEARREQLQLSALQQPPAVRTAPGVGETYWRLGPFDINPAAYLCSALASREGASSDRENIRCHLRDAFRTRSLFTLPRPASDEHLAKIDSCP